MQPRPPADLPDRQPVDPVQPPDLRPLLHANHTLLLARSHRSDEGPDPAGQSRPHARRVTFGPAQVEQYSTGAHTHGRDRPRRDGETPAHVQAAGECAGALDVLTEVDY